MGARGVPRVRAPLSPACRRHERIPLDRNRLPRGLPSRDPGRAPCDRGRREGARGGRGVMLPRRLDPVPVRSDPKAGGAPRVAALGGGTGLPNVLRGLRALLFPDGVRDGGRDRLVAIVATSDDGGSSGRLRELFNMIPPGDIRNCLAALSDGGSQFAEMFQYRFESGDGLVGHAMGNLMIAALADVTRDFGVAVDAASRMLGACGTVLPATTEVVTLVAEFTDGRVMSGETAIAGAGGTIARLSLLPDRPEPSRRVVDAIARADVVVRVPAACTRA